MLWTPFATLQSPQMWALYVMKIAEIKFYLQEHPFVLPFIALLVILTLALPFIVSYHSEAEYKELEGVVCCLSKNHVVYSAKFNDVAKLMYVDLQSGIRVEVPIREVPYISGRTISLRKRSEPDINGIQYQAIGYQ